LIQLTVVVSADKMPLLYIMYLLICIIIYVYLNLHLHGRDGRALLHNKITHMLEEHPQVMDVGDEGPSHLLSRNNTIKHFPPDFDCAQILFSGEKMLWVQRVPPYRRYLPLPFFFMILRHLLTMFVVVILYVLGIKLGSPSEAYAASARTEYLTASVLFFLLELALLHKEFGGTRVDIATNLRVIKAIIHRTDIYVETISYKSIADTTVVSFVVGTLQDEWGAVHRE
jgi:hypothetical protein